MEYYSSGMNDILPKPFTKEGLLDMLEKHLMHLKVMQQMTVVPRSVGVPPLSDANFEQVLMTNATTMVEQQQQMQRHSATALAGLASESNTSDGFPTTSTLSSPIPLSQQQQSSQFSLTSLLSMGEDDVRINNPLAGMGLSDEHYSMILQNLVNRERFTEMGMNDVVGGSGSGSGSGGSGGGSGGIKRTIDDVGFECDKRAGKRSRFEVIE
jgi:osomolarity two-component system response regulator SKN7